MELNITNLFAGPNRFVLQVTGESMIEAGIHDGDYVIVQQSSTARNGDIVVALVDDYEATLTADEPVQWYLLLDNRIDGPEGAASSSNDSDPVLGGTFQWVIDGGWMTRLSVLWLCSTALGVPVVPDV